MKSWLWIGGALLVALAGYLYLARPRPVAVTVTELARGEVEATASNTRAGTVRACRRAGLVTASGGQVARLLVTEGDRVSAGQLLLELWNEDLQAQVRLAASERVAQQAEREEACLNADVAEREFRRLRRLRLDGVVSEEQLDGAETKAKAGRAGCDGAAAAIRVSDAKLDLARAELDRTRLRAPFDGVVAEVTGEVGEFVTPSPPGILTPPAVDLLDSACLYVSAPIDEVDAPQIRPGMPVRVTLDAFRNESFEGSVRRIAPYVLDLEKQARTVEVEVELNDPAWVGRLLPGYSADIEIITDRRADVPRLPTEVLFDGDSVYRVRAGRLEKVELVTGLANWRYTEITAGLELGATVVRSLDREGLADGVAVSVEEPDAAQ